MNRMVLELPEDVQMAIRLAATKRKTRVGRIVEQAIKQQFSAELKEAVRILQSTGGQDGGQDGDRSEGGRQDRHRG
jgi:hypothetical protein